MKTYKELECEAYMAGNTTLAKLYAELEDVKIEIEDLKEVRYWDDE